MSLGVHFALESAAVTSLLAAPADDSRISFLEEQIEERYFTTSEYVAESSLEEPPDVVQIANALDELAVEEFRERYYSIPPDDYGERLTDEDLAYTRGALDAVCKLFRVAALRRTVRAPYRRRVNTGQGSCGRGQELQPDPSFLADEIVSS